MEPIGAAAASIAFLQLAQSSNSLYHKLSSAEDDLMATIDLVDTLDTFCGDLRAKHAVPDDSTLGRLMSKANGLIREFRQQVRPYETGVRKRDRIKLGLRDNPKFTKLRDRVRDLADIASKSFNMLVLQEQGLNAMTKSQIDLLATQQQVETLATREQCADIATKHQLNEVLRAVQGIRDRPQYERLDHKSKPLRSIPDQPLAKTQYWAHTSSQTLKSWLGIQFTVIRKVRRGHRKFIAICQLRLPILQRLLYSNVLYKNAAFKTSMAFPEVVEDNHPLFTACREGDGIKVHLLCWHGTAVPNVVTRNDMTPLLCAVEVGNTEIVQQLLTAGAEVDRCGGSMQTSPLQWAIRHNHLDVVRILLREHADTDYVSSLGWSPLFYCWPDARASWEDRTEIMKLLYADGNLLTTEADTRSWSALQRAAAFGTADDMKLMLRYWKELKGDIRWKTGVKEWEVIHFAVEAGNLPTFNVLLDAYGDHLAEIRDARGWSLLHMAASRRCEAPTAGPDSDPMMIVRKLVERGCNPYLRTPATRAFDLDGVSYCPEDLARRVSPSFHAAYLQVLRDTPKALETVVANNLGLDVDSSDEEFFDCV